MEPPQGDRDLSLPGMPTEILSLIINLVDSESLKTLRLTNKRLCAISSGPFAKRHFSERKHVASAYSMEALVKITAHPFFGKFVKTASPDLASSVRVTIYFAKILPPHHLAMDFEQLRVKLEEAFFNIRQHSSSVSIGVCDLAYRCYGSTYYHADCYMMSDQRDYPNYYSGRDECNQFTKTFEETFRAAQKSGCEIDGIKVDIFSICMPSTSCGVNHGKEVRHMLRYVLGRLPGALSFELNLQMANSFKPRYNLGYDRNTGKFDLAGLHLGSHTLLDDTGSNVESLLSRLSTCSIAYLKLRDCWFEQSNLSWIFNSSQTLTELTLHDVSLYTEHFDTNLWSTVLDRLARTTHLRYLEISQCRYSFRLEINEVDDPYVRKPWFGLPNGLYEMRGQLAWDSKFILAPSGDANEAIILADQASISGQLKSLATQVAQLELDKIAEIERDGYVRTDIVGISKKSQSEEDIVSGGDDDDEVEDDGSAEANIDKSEHEEKEDQDEHEHTVESSAI
ncbi:hypothetical protein KCV07_g4750, partial [Aureobasidium melanogenum]